MFGAISQTWTMRTDRPNGPSPRRWFAALPAAAWVMIAVFGWPVVGASAPAEGLQRTIVLAVAIVVWIVGAAAVSVPSVPSLTVARVLAPAVAVGSVVGWLASADHVNASITSAAAIVAVGVIMSGEFGRTWVQSSAYGDEERFPLRPPSTFLVASVVVWLLATACMLIGLVAIETTARLAAPALIAAVALFALGFPRWHRLSRRWLVLVPAGVVVHDPLVLSETAMWRRHLVSGATLASSDTGAADLSGPAAGHLIELSFEEPTTVVLTDGRRNPLGTAIHLTAGLLAPSRPGAALAALRQRGIRG